MSKIFPGFSFNSLSDIKQGKAVGQILQKVLKRDDATYIDVGCNRGEILKMALKLAPKGEHYAFEAIPLFYERLVKDLGNTVIIKNCAVTNYVGETVFNFVESNPMFSGIKKRDYPKSEKIIELTIPTNTLDNLLKDCPNVDLIRIDVEGAEYDVLDGAKRTIFEHKPHILFEHQEGAAGYYNNGPDKMWNLLVDQLGMQINTLSGFLNRQKPFTPSHFRLLFETGQESFFIAYFD
ncbi:MAG: FkbM family methyltransferase [Flavobacteriales bacterium]|nr:FkbM family methyltransferase [Flavobacteriales bacterium]MCB9198726.1 FkbM family methyltransferase [Flavobacteriales bacterium]